MQLSLLWTEENRPFNGSLVIQHVTNWSCKNTMRNWIQFSAHFKLVSLKTYLTVNEN